MDSDEKLMYMFKKLHDIEEGGVCSGEFELDEYGNATGIHLIKHGTVYWTQSKLDILFDYMTIDL